jgi:hypothetical protein
MDHLMQFAFNFNAAGRHFSRDFSGLPNKNFLSSEFAVNSAVDGRFLGDIQSALERHAVTDHEVIGLIHIGCHVRLSFKNLKMGCHWLPGKPAIYRLTPATKLLGMLTLNHLKPVGIVSQRLAGLVS